MLPSEKVWKNLVSLSDISTDLKKEGKVLPSWLVKQRVCFDPVSILTGTSSALHHIRGREIPERLLLFFRRKANIGSSSSNDLYLDFPEITEITISSSSLSSHFINKTQTSPFTSKITGVKDAKTYGEKTDHEQSLIDIHLNQLTLNNIKAEKGLPILGDTPLAFTPYFALHGHFYVCINLVTAITGEPNIQSPVNEGSFTIRVTFATALSSEYVFDLYGVSNSVQVLNIDKSFEARRLLKGTSNPNALDTIQNNLN